MLRRVMSIQPTAHWVIDTPPILTRTALDDLRGGAQVKNPSDRGESKTAPSTSGSTEQSSSNSVKHISRKMLVAVGSIISAIAIGAGTPLVVKVVDRYFLTPDHQVSTSSPAPPSQGTQPAPPSLGPEPAPPPQETETAEAPPQCPPGDVWDSSNGDCYYQMPSGQAATENPCLAYDYWDPPKGCLPGPVDPSQGNSGENPCEAFYWYNTPAGECIFVFENERPA